MKYTDQIGVEVELVATPKRIISLVPSQTELLFDLGLTNEVVGITKFCVHPEEWFHSKERIGGTKDVNIEKVRSLKPDLIIGNKEENTKEDYEELCEIAPVWMSDVETYAQALEMIQEIGKIVGKESESSILVNQVVTKFQQLSNHQKKEWTYLYFMWKDPYLTAGKDTFIDQLIALIGGKNLQSDVRYPEVDFSKQLQPDVVLLSSEPYPFEEKHVSFFKEHFPNSDIQLVDGEFFCWYGSRLEKAADYFQGFLKRI